MRNATASVLTQPRTRPATRRRLRVSRRQATARPARRGQPQRLARRRVNRAPDDPVAAGRVPELARRRGVGGAARPARAGWRHQATGGRRSAAAPARPAWDDGPATRWPGGRAVHGAEPDGAVDDGEADGAINGAIDGEADGATEGEADGGRSDGEATTTCRHRDGDGVGRRPTGSGPTKTNAARMPAATSTPTSRPAMIARADFMRREGTSTDGPKAARCGSLIGCRPRAQPSADLPRPPPAGGPHGRRRGPARRRACSATPAARSPPDPGASAAPSDDRRSIRPPSLALPTLPPPGASPSAAAVAQPEPERGRDPGRDRGARDRPADRQAPRRVERPTRTATSRCTSPTRGSGSPGGDKATLHLRPCPRRDVRADLRAGDPEAARRPELDDRA